MPTRCTSGDDTGERLASVGAFANFAIARSRSMAAIASTTSFAEPTRSFGSFFSKRSTRSDKAAGTSGFSEAIGAGFSVASAVSTAMTLSPRNGSLPVHSR